MLNHTYTSVKNANLVDCGKRTPVPSQPLPLLRDNYLGEYRTDLDKKKVLANLGIATELSLEWEFIKGDIGRSEALIKELDSRTKYITQIGEFKDKVITIIDGIKYLETIVGGEEEAEAIQNNRLKVLEDASDYLYNSLNSLNDYLEKTIEININNLTTQLDDISEKVANITELIQVSTKEGNALSLITEEHPGLYVPDLSQELSQATSNIETLQTDVQTINTSLESFVKKEDLGGNGNFDFVNQADFDSYKIETDAALNNIDKELDKTVKTGEDGHVDTLYVNTISKNNDPGNIKITDSFEVTDNIPLDIRLVKENLEELYKIPANVCYPGMGVIVNSLSALYILRPPVEGVVINQEYIANANNWKCPEDLVTVALSRQEYENLEEINPYVFYYIYEDEITRTQEPKREDYLTEEEFQKEWQKWVNSLKTLSQQYMSASWGVDIENKLGKKASSQTVSLILAELELIKGNGNNPSLESLNNSIQELQTKDETFKERLDEILIKHEDIEQGRLVNAEKEINKVKEDLSNYVTKDYIQDSSNEFIFVKNSEYESDQTAFKESLANQVKTKEVVSEQLLLQNNSISVKENRLNFNSKAIAEIDDIPVLEVLPQKEYDEKEKKGEIVDSTYYYTYDGDVRLVTNTDLVKESEKLQRQINVLFQGGTPDDIEGTLSTIFLPIETWNNFQEQYEKISNLALYLEQRLLKVEPLKLTHSDNTIYITGDPERCYQEVDTVYINQTVYTDTVKFE